MYLPFISLIAQLLTVRRVSKLIISEKMMFKVETFLQKSRCNPFNIVELYDFVSISFTQVPSYLLVGQL